MTAPLLFLSNGAGEDSIAAQIISCLPQDLPRRALPLVGQGDSFKDLAPLVGPRQSMPSGGLIAQDWRRLGRDLAHGLALLTLRQLSWLRSQRRNFSQLVAVGDLWPVILGALSGIRPLTFIGTAKSNYHHPYSRLEAWVLRAFHVYSLVRDEPTAAHLRRLGVEAQWVGNAMMDGLEPQELDFHLAEREVGLALFPGSRQATYQVLPRLLRLSTKLAAHLERPLCGLVAVAPSIDLHRLAQACADFQLESAPYPGWSALSPLAPTSPKVRFYLVQGHLADVLANSQVALGLAGTAHEQAAGWGLPVVAFEPQGPHNLPWYRFRQQGLLGEALEVVYDRDSAIIEALARLFLDPQERQRWGQIGRQRLGPPGGAARMAQIIVKRLPEPARLDNPKPQ